MAASGDPCVSFDLVKKHVNVYGTDDDDLILHYLQLSQNLVTDRLERATTDTQVLAMIAGWDDETTPAGIKAAVMVQCAELYRFRGDDEYSPVTPDGRLSLRVESLIGSWLERAFA